MGFFVEDSGLIISQILYKAALVLAVTRWALSWVLRLRSRAQNGNDSLHQSHQHPTSSQIMESLILTTFGDISERVLGSCETCAVCLTQLMEDDEVRELRNCCHVFHRECLDRWVGHDDHDHNNVDDDDNHKTCPLCRAPLLTNSQSEAHWAKSEPSWAVERILYLFGDDLLVCD